MFAIVPVHVKVRTAHPVSYAVWSSANAIAFAAFIVFITSVWSHVRHAEMKMLEKKMWKYHCINIFWSLSFLDFRFLESKRQAWNQGSPGTAEHSTAVIMSPFASQAVPAALHVTSKVAVPVPPSSIAPWEPAACEEPWLFATVFSEYSRTENEIELCERCPQLTMAPN